MVRILACEKEGRPPPAQCRGSGDCPGKEALGLGLEEAWVKFSYVAMKRIFKRDELHQQR